LVRINWSGICCKVLGPVKGRFWNGKRSVARKKSNGEEGEQSQGMKATEHVVLTTLQMKINQ
jgi:hypothetical protein